jgi:hypothetical protein
MQQKPRRRSGYFYRTSRKILFLLRRGSIFRSRHAAGGTKLSDPNISTGIFTLITINSTFLFLLAYVLAFIVFNGATALASYAFDIPTIIYCSDISFLIKGIGWTADSVKVVYSAGPLASLLAGIILIVVYTLVAEENGFLRLLVLWMFAHSVVFFFGEIMMGSLFSRGFGFVLMYLYAKDTVMMVITVLSLIGIISLGFRFARLFVVSANIYFNDLPESSARKFLASQFLLPFIAGNILLFLIKLPAVSAYEIGLNATMIFLLIPVMIQGSHTEDLYFDEDPRNNRVYLVLMIITVAVLAGYRIILGAGLKLF